MRARRADDLQMAQFLGADVHQQVFALRILAIEALDRILHRGGELAVGAAELLEQHIAETRIRLVDADGVHQLLDVVIHGNLRQYSRLKCGPGDLSPESGCAIALRTGNAIDPAAWVSRVTLTHDFANAMMAGRA